MTQKKYQIILADPPWLYNDRGCHGTVANHYKGMKIADICSIPINDIADKDCVLFMWAIYPMLREALKVIEAWGFNYKSIAFQWIKLNKKDGKPFFGLGYWTRGNSECCLLATKGKPKRKSASVFQLIQAPRARHSEKPEIVSDKIVELMGDLARIELFARKKRDGWDSVGLEIDGMDILDSIKLLTTK